MNPEIQKEFKADFIKDNQRSAWNATCWYAYYNAKYGALMEGQKKHSDKAVAIDEEIKKIESDPAIVGKEKYESVKKLKAEKDQAVRQQNIMRPMAESLLKQVQQFQAQANRAFDAVEFAKEFELLPEKQKELTPEQVAENEAAKVEVEAPKTDEKSI